MGNDDRLEPAEAFADIICFILLFFWPAVKTFASLEAGTFQGRWGQYWVGITPLVFIYLVLRRILSALPHFTWFRVGASVALSAGNGLLVRYMTNFILMKFYSTHQRSLGGIRRRYRIAWRW
jgi:hypothetical protein